MTLAGALPRGRRAWVARLTGPTARRGGWAVADQALVSGANFLTMLLLARYATKREFGAYVLAFSVLMLAKGLQAALVTGPMQVLGAPRDEDDFRSYVSVLGVVQVGAGAALALLAFLAAGVMYLIPSAEGLRGAFLGMAAALFSVQSQEFVRRTLFARLEAARAFANDVVFCGLQVGAVFALFLLGRRAGAGEAGWLSGRNVFLAMGASGFLGSLLGLWQAKAYLGCSLAGAKGFMGENWVFGRWQLGSFLGGSLFSEANRFIVAAFAGLGGAATIEAPRLLVAPLQILAFGGGNILTPRAAQKYGEGGKSGLLGFLVPAAVAWGFVFLAYAAVVTLAPEAWLRLFYRGKYEGAGTVLVLWACSHALTGLSLLPVNILAVLRRPDLIMYVLLGAGALGLGTSLRLTPTFGAEGALVARVMVEVVILILTVLLAWRVLGRAGPAEDSGNVRRSMCA